MSASIDDMDLLRHGAMDRLFGGVRAPSALGPFLRAFTWGNVSQLNKAHREFLANLARQAPLLPGAETLVFIDVDSTQKRVFGYRKQGAKFGHTKIQGTPPAGRRRSRPDQPRPGPHPHAETATRTPAQESVDKPQNRQRQDKHARKHLVEARGHNRRLGIQPVDRG